MHSRSHTHTHTHTHTHRLLTIAVVDFIFPFKACTHTHKPSHPSINTQAHTNKKQGGSWCMDEHPPDPAHASAAAAGATPSLGPSPGEGATHLARTRPTKPNREKRNGDEEAIERERLQVNRNTPYNPNGGKIYQCGLYTVEFSVSTHTHTHQRKWVRLCETSCQCHQDQQVSRGG